MEESGFGGPGLRAGPGGRYTAPMDRNASREASPPGDSGAPVVSIWERPVYEVIALDCEITAYAPDGDGPLF